MGIIRHPYGVSPDTLIHPCAQSTGEDSIFRSHDAAHSCCVASQRARTVSFDDEALKTHSYRSKFPSQMSQTNLISKGFSVYVSIEGFLHDIDPNV